jgi:hypothetical protein
VARDVAGAIDTVFVRRHMPTDVDFVPSDPPREISAEKWQVILQEVGDILNKLYGKRVFVCTLKFARETVDKPLYQTMDLITQQVVGASS